jgi:hypothetical protein
VSYQGRRHYEGTVVAESKSLLDIEYLLRLHGVQTVRWTTGVDLIRIEFAWPYQGQDLAFRIDLAVPAKDGAGYDLVGQKRDQERRRLLRVLLNHIKAKLVAVEDGLVDLEREFLPYLIGKGGQTMGEVLTEHLKAGNLPETYPLLEGPR